MGKLQDAIDAVHPNSTDEEWTRLLAEAMNAADEIASLRARVAACEKALRTAQALVDCIEQGSGNTWWVNATDPENAVCHTDTVLRAILSHQQGGGDDRS